MCSCVCALLTTLCRTLVLNGGFMNISFYRSISEALNAAAIHCRGVWEISALGATVQHTHCAIILTEMNSNGLGVSQLGHAFGIPHIPREKSVRFYSVFYYYDIFL